MDEGRCVSYLGGPASVRLDAACLLVTDAFGSTCWLVGSAVQGREYRDVDVRIILDDSAYDAVFGVCPSSLSPLRNLLGAAVSAWLAEQAGLPVDFQIQRQSDVKPEDWDKPRVAMGWRTAQNDSDGKWIGPPWQGDR